MKLSNYFIVFTLGLFLYNSVSIISLNAGAGPGADAGAGSFDFSGFGAGADAGGLMAPPTEEELKQIEEFLSTLSEDELKELADIGKQIIETANEQNIPVFAPSGPQAGTEPEKPAKKKADKKKVEEPATNSKDERLKEKFKKMITNLVEIINAIRKKVATEEELSDEIASLDQKLNTLIHYLHIIEHENVIKHILEKDFDALRAHLNSLTDDLETQNDDFIIPASSSLELQNADARKKHKKELKTAQKTFQAIVELLNKAFTQDLLIEELEKVIKKYEPDALKIKEEEEAKQKNAKEFTKRIDNSPTNSGRGSSSYSPYSHDYYASLGQIPAGPIVLTTPTISPSETSAKKDGTKKTEGSGQLLAKNDKGVKTSDDTKKSKGKESKKETPATPTATIADLEKSIPYYLHDVENFLTPKYNTVISFVDDYKKNSDEGPLSSTLRELTFRLDKAKKEIGKWVTLLDKEKNFTQFNASKQKMKDLLADNNYFPTVKELHQRTKKTSNLKDNLKHFHSMMNFIEDKCC